MKHWRHLDAESLARQGLATNPTITVYEMLDGQEFNRRPANPWLGVRLSFDKLGEAAGRASESLSALGESLGRINET
jgi:hypothetical protein